MCEYTQDYADEPHGIVCEMIDGVNVLIDVDEYAEGYDPDEMRCPCPNCDLNAHAEYMVDMGLVDRAYIDTYKKHTTVIVAERMSANKLIGINPQKEPQ